MLPIVIQFYINDISQPPLMAGTMSLYADDVMLYRLIHSQVDFLALQADVDCLSVWTDENHLNFNTAKCKYMVISRKKQPTLYNSPLNRVESYKYGSPAGLVDLYKWRKFVRRQGNILVFSIESFTRSNLLRLYLTYIRPHLEYAAAVWDPHQQGLINSLESVQRFALKVSTRNWKASYDILINTCNVPTQALSEAFHPLPDIQ